MLASAGLPRADVRIEPRILIVDHGRRTRRSRRADRGLAGPPLEQPCACAVRLNLRGYQRVADDHLPDDHAVLARATRGAPRHARRARADRRRLDGTLRSRAERRCDNSASGKCCTRSRSGRASRCGSASDRRARPCSDCPAIRCRARVPVALRRAGARGDGRRTSARCGTHPAGTRIQGQAALACFLPVQLEHSSTLGMVAMPRPTRGSGDFISLLGTDGFVELPPGPARISRQVSSRRCTAGERTCRRHAVPPVSSPWAR